MFTSLYPGCLQTTEWSAAHICVVWRVLAIRIPVSCSSLHTIKLQEYQLSVMVSQKCNNSRPQHIFHKSAFSLGHRKSKTKFRFIYLKMAYSCDLADMDYHGLSWTIMDYHGLSYHRLAWTSMDYHGLAWTSRDYH